MPYALTYTLPYTKPGLFQYPGMLVPLNHSLSAKQILYKMAL